MELVDLIVSGLGIGFLIYVAVDCCFFKKNTIEQKESKSINNNSLSKGEKECKRVIESIYKYPFHRESPSWLVNPKTNQLLELDLYNPKLNIAVNYKGKHHYVWNKIFHKTKADFENQKYKDDIKELLCKENGVYLITVPYFVAKKDIERYISNIVLNNSTK